jgi:hypothetical protein
LIEFIFESQTVNQKTVLFFVSSFRFFLLAVMHRPLCWILAIIPLVHASILSRIEVPSFSEDGNREQTITNTFVECPCTLDDAGETCKFISTFRLPDGAGSARSTTDTYKCPRVWYSFAMSKQGDIAEITTLVRAEVTQSLSSSAAPSTGTRMTIGVQEISNGNETQSGPGGRRLLGLTDFCHFRYCADENEAGYQDAYNMNTENEARALAARRLMASYTEQVKAEERNRVIFEQQQRQQDSRWEARHNETLALAKYQDNVRDTILQLTESGNRTNEATRALTETNQRAFAARRDLLREASQDVQQFDLQVDKTARAMNATVTAITHQNEESAQQVLDLAQHISNLAQATRDTAVQISEATHMEPTRIALTGVYHTSIQRTLERGLRPLIDPDERGAAPLVLQRQQRYWALDTFIEWRADSLVLAPNRRLWRQVLRVVCDMQPFAMSGRSKLSMVDLLTKFESRNCDPAQLVLDPTSQTALGSCICWGEHHVQSVKLQNQNDVYDTTLVSNTLDQLSDWPDLVLATLSTLTPVYLTNSTSYRRRVETVCNAPSSAANNQRRVASNNLRRLFTVQPRLQFQSQTLDACATDLSQVDSVGRIAPTFPSMMFAGLTSSLQLQRTALQQMRRAIVGGLAASYDAVQYYSNPFLHTPNAAGLAEGFTRSDSVEYLATGQFMTPLHLVVPMVSAIDKKIVLDSTDNTLDDTQHDVDVDAPARDLLPDVLYFPGHIECLDAPGCTPPEDPTAAPELFFYDPPLDHVSSDSHAVAREETVSGTFFPDSSTGGWSATNKRPMVSRRDLANATNGRIIPRYSAMNLNMFRTRVQHGPLGRFDLQCIDGEHSLTGQWCPLFAFFLVDFFTVPGTVRISPRTAATRGILRGSAGVLVETYQGTCPRFLAPTDDGLQTPVLTFVNPLVGDSISFQVHFTGRPLPSSVPNLSVASNTGAPACLTIINQTLAAMQSLELPLPACGLLTIRVTTAGAQPQDPRRICSVWDAPISATTLTAATNTYVQVSAHVDNALTQRITELGAQVRASIDAVAFESMEAAKAILFSATIDEVALHAHEEASRNHSETFQAQLDADARHAAAGDALLLESIDSVRDQLAEIKRNATALIKYSDATRKLAADEAELQDSSDILHDASNVLGQANQHLLETVDGFSTNLTGKGKYESFTNEFFTTIASWDCDSLDDPGPNPECDYWYALDDNVCDHYYLAPFLIGTAILLTVLLVPLALIPGAFCDSIRRALNSFFFVPGKCPPKAFDCQGKKCPLCCRKSDRLYYPDLRTVASKS